MFWQSKALCAYCLFTNSQYAYVFEIGVTPFSLMKRLFPMLNSFPLRQLMLRARLKLLLFTELLPVYFANCHIGSRNQRAKFRDFSHISPCFDPSTLFLCWDAVVPTFCHFFLLFSLLRYADYTSLGLGLYPGPQGIVNHSRPYPI